MRELIFFTILLLQKYKNWSLYFNWTPHCQVLWIADPAVTKLPHVYWRNVFKSLPKGAVLDVLHKIKEQNLIWRSCRSVTRWQTTNDKLFVKTAWVSWKLAQEHWYFTYGSKGVSATHSHSSFLISVKLEIGYLRVHLHGMQFSYVVHYECPLPPLQQTATYPYPE
jgi:hypothetical protein